MDSFTFFFYSYFHCFSEPSTTTLTETVKTIIHYFSKMHFNISLLRVPKRKPRNSGSADKFICNKMHKPYNLIIREKHTYIYIYLYLIFPVATGPGVYSASNRNEYQKH
jgi:hypothetical protein